MKTVGYYTEEDVLERDKIVLRLLENVEKLEVPPHAHDLSHLFFIEGKGYPIPRWGREIDFCMTYHYPFVAVFEWIRIRTQGGEIPEEYRELFFKLANAPQKEVITL